MREKLNKRTCDQCKKIVIADNIAILGQPEFGDWITINMFFKQKKYTGVYVPMNKDFCSRACAIKYLQKVTL